jgi:subtilisin family serine protease
MERTYTILLDRAGRHPARNSRGWPAFDQPLDHASRLLADPPRPAIHRERLTAQELQELTQEPEFVAAAEIMRTRLLSPVSEAVLEEGVVSSAPKGRQQPWGIAAVGADRSKYTGADVAVAMLDTGIDASHAAFRGVDLVEKDFTGTGNGDSDGHGTHCAGIFFGRNVDGIRIGVANGVRRALIGKILQRGGGDSDMMIRGVAWAHEEGAHVISMSVGFDFAATVGMRVEQGWTGELATAVTLEAYRANLRLLDRLLQMLRSQEPFTGGAVMIAAAGNDSSRGSGGDYIMSACPPSGSDRIVSVGSLDPDPHGKGYRVSRFSNTGVDITAPGSGIISAAAGGGLKVLSGTSVAAPHVAGVAALWWQAVRQSDLPANATVVRGKLVESAQARGFSPAVYPAERGAGRAAAPADGLALLSPRSMEGSARARGNHALMMDAQERLPNLTHEPISIDFRKVTQQEPSGRQKLM